MKKTFLFLMLSLMSWPSLILAQDGALPDNFLFDDSDIIVTAPQEPSDTAPDLNTDENISQAVSSAKQLLQRNPAQLQTTAFPELKKRPRSSSSLSAATSFKEAPFGLRWGSRISDTRNQGVELSVADMEDYVNCFLSDQLPKAVAFFNRVYLCYGQDDELYRILAYSKLIADDASASEIMHEYDTYSSLLNQKYGHKEQFFTPATVNKTIKNAQGRDEVIQEQAPIGNPQFLSQLESGAAVLYSTYYNDEVAATLSIGVDGDKKSYIVIDYKNLPILKQQEAETLDAL